MWTVTRADIASPVSREYKIADINNSNPWTDKKLIWWGGEIWLDLSHKIWRSNPSMHRVLIKTYPPGLTRFLSVLIKSIGLWTCSSTSKQVTKSAALAKVSKGKKKKKKAKKKGAIKKENVAYYTIPVDFEITGNFIGYIKFKRALSLSKKMLNFDKESIKVVKGDTTGAIKVTGKLTIVGLDG